jgi:uncharacterized protein (DUF1499 family)
MIDSFSPWARRLSRVALAAAAAGLVLLIVAGPGTRFGVWGFRTGLNLLHYAVFGGLGAIVFGLAALVAGARAKGLLAVVVGLATVAVPWLWQRTARSVPPIHDITTDTEDPPRFVAVLARRGSDANAADYAGAAIATQQKGAYPELTGLVLAEPPAAAFARVRAALARLGLEEVAAEEAEGRIEATDTTPWFGFKDDVVVRLRPQGAGTRVDVRSLSRVGRSDLGTNAKRIRRILAALQG